jgi:starch synthase
MTVNLPRAAYDNKIYAKFSKSTIEKKQENKKEFCKEFQLQYNARQLLIGVVLKLSTENGATILADILPGIATLNICLAVRGIGSTKFQKILSEFSKQYPEKIIVIGEEEDTLRKILAATDVSFYFRSGAENEELAQAALSYASLPIAPISMQHIVEDYNPNQESGNGFIFQDENYWSAFAALIRAHENFRFPYDWKGIQRNALEI